MNSEITSNMLMLMAAPTPVRSRAYSAASTPVSEYRPVPMSATGGPALAGLPEVP